MTLSWADHPADPLEVSALQGLLSTQTIGQTLRVLASTTSTNDVLKTLAQQGAPEGTVVLADHQTHGRGRYGRTFASPPGVGIYLSLLLRPPVEAHQLSPLTFVAAVAAAEAIGTYSALPVQLKWPNDVEIHAKKVAGILSEAVLHPPAPPAVILGIGINVNTTLSHLPPELHPHVTSLALAAGHPWPRSPLIVAFLTHFEHWYQLFQQGAREAIFQAWLRYSALLGRQVAFTHAAQTAQGLVVGLDHDGALLVQQATGAVCRVVAGEVSFL
ncbi:MAG: biotin--[acetyl-CoA-carboxylase] ligase [Candidatus Tectimicrobiota bacterium]